MNSFTLDIPDDLAIPLAATARRMGTTEEEVIRKAIDHYLRTVARPRPKSIGMVADGSLQSEDIDDWLRENWLGDILGEDRVDS